MYLVLILNYELTDNTCVLLFKYYEFKTQSINYSFYEFIKSIYLHFHRL